MNFQKLNGQIKKTIRLKGNDVLLFSLDNMKKYNILKIEISIYCNRYNFFYFMEAINIVRVFLYKWILENKSYENHSTKAYDVSSNICLSG